VGDFLREQGINFCGRMESALNQLGAYDLKTIAAISKRELAQCEGVGPKKIAKLRTFLQSKGLDLQE
jgi:predicted flap endonuclease-1-like 5' DNA nuclease